MLGVCTLSDCSSYRKTKLHCDKHHYRFKKYGDPLAGPTHKGEPKKYFYESIEKETNKCVEWRYGKIDNYGTIFYKGKKCRVPRIALLVKVGQPPADKPLALHKCHNPACFNPRHLYWGNRVDNERDKLQDGTSNRGEQNGQAKLKAEDIPKIRRDERNAVEISKDYGVSSATILHVKRGSTWYWL